MVAVKERKKRRTRKSKRPIDLNKIYGSLEIICKMEERGEGGKTLYKTKCLVCDKDSIKRISNIHDCKGDYREGICFCENSEGQIGKTFGSCKVIKVLSDRTKSGRTIFECECIVCGEKFNRDSASLKKTKGDSSKCYCRDTSLLIIDKVYGTIKVLELLNKKGSNGQTLYRCECTVCKELSEKVMSKIKRETQHEEFLCGCKNTRKIVDGFPSWKFARLIQSAKHREYEFDLTPSYLAEMLITQNYKCRFSGVDIFVAETCESSPQEGFASLDRIDSKEGYIMGNVQWVHKDVNQMKMNSSDDKFIEWCKDITKYNS